MRRYPALGLLLGGCCAYAAVRYVVLGDTPPSRLPAYVANKGISLAGLVLLAAAAIPRPASWRRWAGLMGLALVSLHVLLSMSLLGAAYFPKLYAAAPAGGERSLTAWGELSLLLGAIGLIVLLVQGWPSRYSPEPEGAGSRQALRRRAGTAVLVLSALHNAALGWSSWLTPSNWPGGLPPITLLSAAVAAAGVVLSAIPRPE